MKTCSRCKEGKQPDQFNKDSRYRDGLQSYCKPCALEASRKSELRYPERRKAKNHAWERANPERRRALNVRSRLKKYGITALEYLALLEKQGHACAICQSTEPGWSKSTRNPVDMWSWQIDHDHSCCPAKRSCGKCVRGLLCNRCNIVLGQAEEDLGLLDSMRRYLTRVEEA